MAQTKKTIMEYPVMARGEARGLLNRHCIL